jgi:hypothetical protein
VFIEEKTLPYISIVHTKREKKKRRRKKSREEKTSKVQQFKYIPLHLNSVDHNKDVNCVIEKKKEEEPKRKKDNMRISMILMDEEKE